MALPQAAAGRFGLRIAARQAVGLKGTWGVRGVYPGQLLVPLAAVTMRFRVHGFKLSGKEFDVAGLLSRGLCFTVHRRILPVTLLRDSGIQGQNSHQVSATGLYKFHGFPNLLGKDPLAAFDEISNFMGGAELACVPHAPIELKKPNI